MDRNSCCDCLPPVDAVDLTFTTYEAGYFVFDLSAPISSDVIIQAANVSGFSDVDCGIATIESDY